VYQTDGRSDRRTDIFPEHSPRYVGLYTSRGDNTQYTLRKIAFCSLEQLLEKLTNKISGLIRTALNYY